MSIEKNQEIYLILDNIRSLFNVGSLFRTADVFNVSKIFLCGYTGTPPRKEISKVALGAEEWIPWEHHEDINKLIKLLKKQGIKIASLETDAKAQSLADSAPTFPIALIVGNEVEGISPKTLKASDQIIEIPMLGKKESLNVATAAGIALYGLRWQ